MEIGKRAFVSGRESIVRGVVGKCRLHSWLVELKSGLARTEKYSFMKVNRQFCLMKTGRLKSCKYFGVKGV